MDTIESERLRTLTRSHLLDSAGEEAFDRFTRLASMLLDTPVALVSLVDRDRQYFKSFYGLPESWGSRRETPLSHSFCQYVVASQQPLIVEDARTEKLLRFNPAIHAMGVVAYLGFPLVVGNQVLGSFCVIDNQPRAWTEREIHIVSELAHFVATEIALRLEVEERKKVEKLLRASEESFRTLANQVPIMIWQADIEGSATFHNATWMAFTGCSNEDGKELRWISAIHPDERAAVLEVWKRAFAEHLPYHSEFRLRRADGVYRDVVSHGELYTDRNGTQLGYIGTLIDVSEQKELERRRETSLNIITHELKNPLAAIQANIQLAQRRLTDLIRNPTTLDNQKQLILSQVKSRLAHGMANLHDQAQLIDDLLDLSRFQVGKLEFHLETCDLVELVKQLLQDKRITQPEREITLALPDRRPLLVRADAQRTRQVLNNYLTNALKYSPPDQPIRVELAADETCAYVRVRDHGLGLTPEQQERIWDCFYQTHETPAYTKDTPGLGLGLYICQLLVRGQQGEVGVESARGAGSTFWFTLPLAT